MHLTAAQLRNSTRVLIGAIASFGVAMQLDVVKNYVTPILAAHPKIAPAIASLAGIGFLLHRPEVQQALGLQLEETTTKTTVAVVPLETPAGDKK